MFPNKEHTYRIWLCNARLNLLLLYYAGRFLEFSEITLAILILWCIQQITSKTVAGHQQTVHNPMVSIMPAHDIGTFNYRATYHQRYNCSDYHIQVLNVIKNI